MTSDALLCQDGLWIWIGAGRALSPSFDNRKQMAWSKMGTILVQNEEVPSYDPLARAS